MLEALIILTQEELPDQRRLGLATLDGNYQSLALDSFVSIASLRQVLANHDHILPSATTQDLLLVDQYGSPIRSDFVGFSK